MRALQRTWLLVLFAAATVMAQTPAPAPAPRVFPPSAAQRAQIDAKLADLTKQVEALAAKKADPALLADAAVYQKAAKFILRYPEEFSTANYVPETIGVLDAGLARAAELAAGNASWSKKTGNVVRAYVSRIDGSVQPYGLTIPSSYDGTKPIRLDVWLHGTSLPLNEVRFITQQSKPHPETNAPEPTDYIQLEPLGRMNQSYRYSGETDVFEAIASVQKRYNIDAKRILIRGHSMGGQAFHLGLQHPGFFAALEASAGYTDTHEYAAARLPKEGLPLYQEATLHYYDSQDYAMNAFNVISVGHGGETDAQLRASQRIREALEKDGIRFTQETPYRWTTKDMPAVLFLVSPQTGHAWRPDVKAESEAFLRKNLVTAGALQPRVRCVTYTARWNDCDWVSMNALDQTYQRADLDATRSADFKKVTATTKGLSQIAFTGPAASYTLDGQSISAGANPVFDKDTISGKWSVAAKSAGLRKIHGLQGPIDDAFIDSFIAVRGTGQPWNAGAEQYAQKRFDMLKGDFAKWMRGDVRVKDDTAITAADIASSNLILFGDPGSNSVIAKILDRLPIQWTKTDVTVGSQKFTAADNVPVLVYPNPLNPQHYIVINSGHTFNDDHNLTGTESLFFPRLGDYAVVHVNPAAMVGLTPAGDVKLSGFFDESWKLK